MHGRDIGPHIPKSQHVAALNENINNSCVPMETGMIKINLCLHRSLVDLTNSLRKWNLE